MPVEDHAIHPSTQKGEDFRWGCWNRPAEFEKEYYAPNRVYRPNDTFYIVLEPIKFRMTHECMPAKMGEAARDPFCEGCQWRR